MVKKEEVHKGYKIGFIIASVFIALIVLLFVYVIFFASPSGQMEEVIELYNYEYSPALDKFLVYYGDYYNGPYNTNAQVDLGLENIEKAKKELTKMDGALMNISEIIDKGKEKSKGEKKEWFTQVEICYDLRVERVDLLSTLTKNYDTYLQYLEAAMKYDSADSFYNTLAQRGYTELVVEKNEDKYKSTLDEMRTQIEIMQNSMGSMGSLITLPSDSDYNEALNKKKESLDLLEKAVDSSGTTSDNYAKQSIIKSTESSVLLAQAGESYSEEIDEWYLENIQNIDREAYGKELDATTECNRASDIWDSITGNVVDEE